MQTSILQVKGLSKKLKRFTLGPIDLQVEQGIIVGLVGANGSGKSTLFRIWMNLLKSDTGHVELFGQDVNSIKSDWKTRVGYAGEILDGYGFLTVSEMKKFISRWYSTWDEDLYEQLIMRYKIDVKEKFNKCSKGTKKKIEFIFALCHHPDILILDEPTAGVDIASRRRIKEDLIRFMEDGDKSIVMATHTIDEINQLCDEIIVLENGKVIQSFNKDDIYHDWARIRISDLSELVKQHPNVLHYEIEPAEIITNNVHILETVLQRDNIQIHQQERLTLEEVLQYLIDKE